MSEQPREWTLRVNSNNDGGGYLYSGSDISYPEDDYIEVVEKTALTAANAEIADLKERLLKAKEGFIAIHDYINLHRIRQKEWDVQYLHAVEEKLRQVLAEIEGEK